jgi:hypothetical protein
VFSAPPNHTYTYTQAHTHTVSHAKRIAYDKDDIYHIEYTRIGKRTHPKQQ